MRIWKYALFAGLWVAQAHAFDNATWVLGATLKFVRVNGTNAVFKINEAAPSMTNTADSKMNTYYFKVDLSNQEGKSAYTALLMAKYSGQAIQYYVPSNTPTSGTYPVQNVTYGLDN